MTETDLRVFLDGTVEYLQRVTHVAPELEAPYLREQENVLLDYTGAVNITGQERGCIMFTAKREMLREMLAATGEEDLSEASCRDLIGEVANTISGNARREFGSQFQISTPWIFEAAHGPTSATQEARTFVIPIFWNRHRSNLLVALES